MFSIKLGMSVKNIDNGFVGTVTGIYQYIHHETQYLVESIDTTGIPMSEWCSFEQLEYIEEVF